jgi:hypothetical protein
MAKLPAYITIAFDLTGALSVQQIQYREVVDVDGELLEVKQHPPDLITAPQPNDQLTATLTAAVGAIAAGHLEAVRVANAKVAELTAEVASKDANVQALLASVAELEAAKKVTVEADTPAE